MGDWRSRPEGQEGRDEGGGERKGAEPERIMKMLERSRVGGWVGGGGGREPERSIKMQVPHKD